MLSSKVDKELKLLDLDLEGIVSKNNFEQYITLIDVSFISYFAALSICEFKSKGRNL